MSSYQTTVNAGENKRPSAAAIWAAMLSVWIVWGSTYLAIRFAVETLPPYLLAAARFLIAGVLLYGFRRLRGDPAPKGVEWRSAAVVGFFLLVCANGWVVWAEQRVPSGIAALMVASSPLWMVIIDAFRPGGRKPGWVTLTGVMIGLVGLVLLVGPSDFGGERVDLIGAGVLSLAALFWAIGSLYSRTAKLPASPLLGTGMEMLAGGLGLLIIGVATGELGRVNLAEVSAKSLYGLGYLIIFGSLVGFASYTWLLRVAPTPLVSTYAYVNPMIAVLLGNLLAREPLTLRVLLSAGVIIGSVILITAAQPMKKKGGETATAPAPGDAPVTAGDD